MGHEVPALFAAPALNKQENEGAKVTGYNTHVVPAVYHHLGKREAEAEPEADPALLYSTYGYGYPGYGYSTYGRGYSLGYGAYSYGLGYPGYGYAGYSYLG